MYSTSPSACTRCARASRACHSATPMPTPSAVAATLAIATPAAWRCTKRVARYSGVSGRAAMGSCPR